MDNFEVIELSPDISVIGFKSNVEERQSLVSKICGELKTNINNILDENCKNLLECTNDKRSIFSLAYLFSGIPASEEEIINKSESGLEISEEAVQNVIRSFRSRCTDKIRDIENVIHAIRVLDPNIDISEWRDNIETLREIDRLIVVNLQNAATWKNVIIYDDSMNEEFI